MQDFNPLPKFPTVTLICISVFSGDLFVKLSLQTYFGFCTYAFGQPPPPFFFFGNLILNWNSSQMMSGLIEMF